MQPNDGEEITSLKIDDKLIYLHDEASCDLLQQAQQREDFNLKDEYSHKYNLPKPKEFHLFSTKIYNNYQNDEEKNVDIAEHWQLLYRVQGKVIYEQFDGFFAELYFNTENHYLLLVIKGTTPTSIGNVWSDITNVGFGSKGGELDSAFTFGEKVRELMNKFKCKPMLLITGHSLGGYWAQIITYTITYCFVDGNGKVKARKEPMDDFGIYTVVFDSPAAFKQISSIVPRDPIQTDRFSLPIVNFIIDVNIINSNSTVGSHLGQVISVKEFQDFNAPNVLQRIFKAKSIHGIQNFEDIDITQCRQVEYLPHKKTVKYEEKEIQSCFFSAKNIERLHKYLILAAMCAEFVEILPKFKILNFHIFLQDDKVSHEEFIPRAHRFLSQFKKSIDDGDFNGKNIIDTAMYNLWRAEMLKNANEFVLNEEWIKKVKNWEDGTTIGGFESYEEMRFVGCMLHNSIPSFFHYDFEQYIGLDKKEVDKFKETNTVTLILIVKNKNQEISHKAGKRVKIVYLVLNSIAHQYVTLNPSALDAKSQKKLKNTKLQFMGNEVNALDIFGNEFLEKLKIWDIYKFHKDAVPTPNHFYNNQEISGNYMSFRSAISFAREFVKKEMPFVLISSDAGMGKSTALRQIALTLQQELPNYWIVHINLFDIQSELSSAKGKMISKEEAVEFVRNLELADCNSDELLARVFNWKLQEKKMIFLFDSLDEVCPFHREAVEKFIELLREIQILIVLTTRPHEGQNLLNANLFELKPLNWQQKRNFIDKKFKMFGKNPPSDPDQWLDNISDNEDFWSLPLNLNMAASLYDADIAEPKGLRGNQNIYEQFITKCIENTLKIKFNLEKNEHQAASMQIYNNHVEKFSELFEILAVCLIFHGGIINDIQSEKLQKKIKKNGESLNRFDVLKLDKKYELVSFLHRSYAECLVAKVFLKCHKKDLNCQVVRLNDEQLNRIYLEDVVFFHVRKHVCRILAASPSLTMDFVPDFINGNENKLLHFLIYDDCYEMYMQLKMHNCKFSFEKRHFESSLFFALEEARKEFVQQLIKDGANFEDILNEEGVLHLAIKKGLHQEVKQHFESLKVNMDYTLKLPLYYAAKYASRDLVEFLIEKGADIDAENKVIGKTALYAAVKANNTEVCELLITKGAKHANALEWAAQFGRIELFDLIYKNTPSKCRLKRVREAHFEAAFNGKLNIFKHICALPEADPLALNSHGATFLQWAARNGHLHCMPFILTYMNQSVDFKNQKGQTALMWALHNHEEEIAKWLLEQHADIHESDHKGKSCLHCAARGRNLDAVEMCLDSGADVDSQDNDGKTALYHATDISEKCIVKYLLEQGANPEITDKYGNTCLHEACLDLVSVEIAKLLVELLPLNCTNDKGETPLHWAAINGNTEMVAFLLEKAKKQMLEPVDDDKIIRLTRIIRRDPPFSKSREDAKNEISEWKYIVKGV